MGGACCKSAPEFNPDGSEKEPQTAEQGKDDPEALRRWAKDGDSVELERLLKRMPAKGITSGAKKSEGMPEEEGHTALHFAAARGSLPCVELLVLYGAAVNGRGAGGATPLHTALEGGRRQVAHFLLEHGADINAPDRTGATPFLAVLASGRKRLSGWLLQRCGAAIDTAAADKAGLTAATHTARNGWWELLEKLAGMAADPGAALNTRSSEGDTPLGWVLKYGAAGLLSGEALAGVVARLLAAGASAVVPAFKEQIPPLCLAAATGNAAVLAALRSRGAELDPLVTVDALRRNALHYAAAKGHEALCELLMAEGGPGMQPHVTDAAGNTPLHLAALRGHADTARVLLEKGQDKAAAILTPNLEGVSTYHLMLQAGPEDRSQRGVLWILDHISAEEAQRGIMAKEVLLETPLLLAVASHQDRVVARLLEAGHDPNKAADVGGDTPLSCCLASATAETAAADGAIFRLLLEKGASMESSSSACHPLLAICQNPLSRFSEQVVELLVGRAGGDAAALNWGGHADGQGRGPLHLAALHDNAFMCSYLLETAKLEVDAPSSEGLTPLMYAAWGCAPNAMRVLLNRRADPRAAAPDGSSPLSYCLTLDRAESLACAAMLLMLGAAAEDCTDLRGEGFIHRAVRYGSSEFIRLWVRYGGNVTLMATTDDAANDLAEKLPRGSECRKGPAEDYLDAAPQPLEVEEEAEDGAWDLGSGKMDGAAAAAAAAMSSDGGLKGMEAEKAARRASFEGQGGGGADGDGGYIKAHREEDQTPAEAAGYGNGDGGQRRSGPGGGGEVEEMESFSMPGMAGGGDGDGSSRAMAEAVEVEVARYPSFCRRPSVVEVRRWARRGAAWFDDALPTIELGADGEGPDPCLLPPSLPLPPDEEEEEAEEARLAAEEQPDVHPSLDSDAIWRRMLLARLKDRRPAAAAAMRHTGGASTAAMAAVGAGPVAEATEQQQQQQRRQSLDGPSHGAATGGVSGSGVSGSGGSFLNRLITRRGSAGGSGLPGSPAAGSPAAGRAAAGLMERLASGSGRSASASNTPRRRPSAAGAAAVPVTSAGAGAASAFGAHSSFNAAESEWLDELTRSAESVMATLTRGEPITAAGVAGGSGSRAVRSMRGSRDGRRPASPPGSDGAGEEGHGARAGKARRVRGPGAVAEGREGSSGSDTSDDSENEGGGEGGGATGEGKLESALEDLKDAGMGLASKLVDKRVAITDPYYKKGSKYKGVPKYLDDAQVNVAPAGLDELLALADQLAGRLARYPQPADEAPLSGADLRERNMKWYNLGLSPAEYPMKLGQWKAAVKKAKAAAAAARLRAPRAAGSRPVVRSRKAWFGLPAMPSRPELKATSALVLAVRLCRPACVAALLAASLQPLNVPDGWGATPAAYAAYMLARDKHNAQLQQVYDMLLAKLPQVNYTRLDSEDGSKGHSLLCPINLAVISGDAPRLAHLVLRCAGAINNSWTALADIPTYLNGLWEKAVAKCDSRCPPLALAVLSKRIDGVKLCLDLGANPNTFGESRDVKLKAKLAREWAEEKELSRRLADEYAGILSKTKLGVMQKLARLKRAISKIEIPGFTKPHPFVTPLHLAARTGQAEVAFLLLRRGALSNGGPAVPYAKYSPLQEAMMYARSNFSLTNSGAKRKNWKEVRPALEDLPSMSDEAAKKDADQKANAIMRALVDPTVIALKAVALAAKYAVNFLLEMRKRPIAHHDPAIWAAHVLLSFRAPYDLADTQTGIVLRDIMDNGKWKWLRRPAAKKFKVVDDEWTSLSRSDIDSLKSDPDIGYDPIRSTPEPKEYRQLKQQFVARCDQAYFGSGSKALHARWTQCSEKYLAVQSKYVYEELMPAISLLASKAVVNHVQGSGALLEVMGAARREALEGSAAALEAGVALEEGGVMDPQPYKAFALPQTLAAAAAAGAAVAAAAQSAAAGELRALAGRAAGDESWGRVMLWGSSGMFIGMPGEGDLEALPSGQEELNALSKELAGVDTDELKESLENLQENLDVAVDWLLAKMQDAQEGLSNLLEVIGIDFLDML